MAWLIDDLVGLAQALAAYISQALETLIDCLFYPFEKIFYWFSAIANVFIEAVKGIMGSLWNIYNILHDFLFGVLSAALPYSLTILIFTGLSILFLFRIYRFVKGVSIAGFKLG